MLYLMRTQKVGTDFVVNSELRVLIPHSIVYPSPFLSLIHFQIIANILRIMCPSGVNIKASISAPKNKVSSHSSASARGLYPLVMLPKNPKKKIITIAKTINLHVKVILWQINPHSAPQQSLSS